MALLMRSSMRLLLPLPAIAPCVPAPPRASAHSCSKRFLTGKFERDKNW